MKVGRVKKCSDLVSQYQFLHRDPCGISGKFPGYFRENSQKSLGNFPENTPSTRRPPNPIPHHPDFKWFFLEMSKFKSDQNWHLLPMHRWSTSFIYKTVSFCAQGSREARKFLRYLGIKLSKTVRTVVYKIVQILTKTVQTSTNFDYLKRYKSIQKSFFT